MIELVGRQAELAAARTLLDTTRPGLAVLLLEGASGIGKSSIWRSLCQHAAREGWTVLACRPAAAERTLTLSALADLLGPVPDAALAGLPTVQRRALEAALLATPQGSPATPATSLPRPEQRALSTAVRTLLSRLAAERPLLIAIDDVQWLDRASAAVLQFALRRLGSEPVRLAAVRRLSEPARLDLDAIADPEAIRRLPLGPLTVDEIGDLLERRLDNRLPRSIVTRIHDVAGGNALFALEVGRQLLEHGVPAPGEPMPVPPDVRRLARRRIGRLPASTREVLTCAAALAQPRIDVIEDALGRPALSDLEPAEHAGIVIVHERLVHFEHPIYAAAMEASISAGERTRLHRRLADVVHDPEQRARHLARGWGPDEHVAAELEQAATGARERGAWSSGAELLELAASRTPTADGDEVARRLTLAAEYHVHAGDRQTARSMLDGILARPLSRARHADALRLLAEISFHDLDFAAGARLFEEALAWADDPAVAVACELGLCYMRAHQGGFDVSARHANRALALARALGDEALIAEALMYTVMYGYLGGGGVAWADMDWALSHEDPTRLVPLQSRPHMLAAALLLYTGSIADARRRLTEVETRSLERGDESDVAFVLLWLSWLETRAGNLDRAWQHADRGAALARLNGSDSTHAWMLGQLALIAAHRGDEREVRRLLEEAATSQQRFGNMLVLLWLAASESLLELSLGNPARAVAACEPLLTRVESEGIGEPVPLFFLPDALEALVTAGQVKRAEEIVDVLEERAREPDRRWASAVAARGRALVLASAGDLPAAARAAEASVSEFERLEMVFDRARSLLVLGQVRRRQRRRGQAREAIDEAQRVFERIGTPLWAGRAREELRRLGLRHGDARDLTPNERRIADFAASGMTNQEIAAAQFVSVKTVEAVLTSAYRKLEIRSRSQLAGAIGQRPAGHKS